MGISYCENEMSEELSEDQKIAFLKMPQEEQLAALFGMLAYVRSDLANIKKEQIGFGQDLDSFKRELRNVRITREKMEQERQQNTDQKIEAALSKRFDFWVYLRDRVLPGIITLILLAVLYLTFGGQAP